LAGAVHFHLNNIAVGVFVNPPLRDVTFAVNPGRLGIALSVMLDDRVGRGLVINTGILFCGLCRDGIIHPKKPRALTVAFCRDKWIPYCKSVQSARARLGLHAEVPDHQPIKFYQAIFFLSSLVT
jgi:hypothetical protein